jgi:glycosyltransferase involved in cell wall biosynthesis
LFHIWVPNWHGYKGGIQVYSSFLIEALREIRPDLQYAVFIKHDTRGASSETRANKLQAHYAGAWPAFARTLAYSAQIAMLGYWQKPSLIVTTHLHFARAAFWLKRTRGIPYWVVAHGIEAWGISKPSLKTALREADQVFAVSNYTRDRLIAEGILEPDRIAILPDTLEPRLFDIGPKPAHLLRRYGLTPDQKVIFTLARLAASEQYKGYDKILQALPPICRAIPGVKYILAGKGDDRPRIESLIRELGLSDSVILTGYLPDEELCDHYNLCDVFAMPSKGEGFGIVYLEALACGKPTLAGNKDGSVDALCNGELGALIDPDDVQQIAQSLIQILDGSYPNPTIYDQTALRRRVIEVYGYESFREKLAGHLEAFLTRRAARQPAQV